MLTNDLKIDFLNTIIELRQKLEGLEARNTLQELERFENQLTLTECEECFLNTTVEACEAKLRTFFSQRWDRIRGSSMCYTQKPANEVNQLCVNLAHAISPPTETPEDIEALKPKTGPYCLLMPSLKKSNDVYGENIHKLQLHEFVLSDDEAAFIPLVSCLSQAAISDEGKLRHMVGTEDEKYPLLTPSERERVSKHSEQTAAFYQSILALNHQRLLGDEIGPKLSQLALALRSGGSHTHRGNGTELNSGDEANLGIATFYHYWQGLSKKEKASIFEETPKLKEILGRLFRPTDVNYRNEIFCVETLAEKLDPIISIYHQKPSTQTLQKIVDDQENVLKDALKKPENFVIFQNDYSPKHILHRIFKLSPSEQKKFFKHDDHENALMYALSTEPEALPEFDLDEASKQRAALARVNAHNDSALIVAAKLGKLDSVKLLLSWGSDIEARDIDGSNVLHWAANHGHVEIVEHLLMNGALLDDRGHEGATALHFAVRHGKAATAKMLIKKNADIMLRDDKGENVLDVAIKNYPMLVQPIVMKIATLPVEQQAECLRNVLDGPYPNAFFYAAVTGNNKLLKLLLDPFSNSGPLDFKMQHIRQHIYLMGYHYQIMKRKSLKNPRYKAAVSSAESLLSTCIDEMRAVYESSRDNTDVKMQAFKNNCIKAIATARPVLSTHREWGKVLAAFLLVVVTLPMALVIYALGLFSVKTKSENLLNNLNTAVTNVR